MRLAAGTGGEAETPSLRNLLARKEEEWQKGTAPTSPLFCLAGQGLLSLIFAYVVILNVFLKVVRLPKNILIWNLDYLNCTSYISQNFAVM